MSVIVLEERDEGSSHRSHLVRSHVHVIHLFLGDDREVCLKTALDSVFLDVALIVHLHLCEGNVLVFLFFGGHVVPAVLAQVNLSVLDRTVRSLDETELVDAREHAKRRDKTDVRTFWRLDRAQTSVMGVVYVSNLESGPVP